MTKQKTCKAPGCETKFTPSRPFQTWCSFDCAIVLADITKKKKEASKARIERMERKAAKEKAKPRKKWLKEAQIAFNNFIRARDIGKPCISSGIAWQDSFQAGHFMATSIRPELRFHEDNVNGQSVRDNLHLHGNLLGYRKGLIERIGLEKVEWLEGPHEPKHYSIEDLKEIKAKYSQLARELRKERK